MKKKGIALGWESIIILILVLVAVFLGIFIVVRYMGEGRSIFQMFKWL